jgi:EAL domain-containing protein (putative c-di-GMP-specific phosphodiesterase class I)
VAEGVERESQVDFLRSESCDFAQGYYLGLPVPAETFAGLLRKGNNHPYQVDAHRRVAGLT